jgi:hypothetical protein
MELAVEPRRPGKNANIAAELTPATSAGRQSNPRKMGLRKSGMGVIVEATNHCRIVQNGVIEHFMAKEKSAERTPEGAAVTDLIVDTFSL